LGLYLVFRSSPKSGEAPGQLPRAARTDSHQVTSGYAVGMAGRLPQVWVFFDHLELAVAFGRAARM